MADQDQAKYSKEVAENTASTAASNEQNKKTLSATDQLYANSIEKLAEQISLTRSLSREVDDLLGITRRRSDEEKALVSIASTLGKIGSQNLELSRRDNTLAKDRLRLEKSRSKIEAELKILKEGDSSLNESDLKILSKINSENDLTKVLGAELFQQKLEASKLEGENLTTALKRIAKEEQDLDILKEQVARQENLLSDEGKRVVKLEQALLVADSLNTSLKLTEKRQADINQTTGLAGEILEGVNRIGLRVFGGLGINLGIISEAFQDGKNAMVEFAAEVAESGEGVGTLANRTIALGKGINAFAKNLPNLLTDPLVLGGVLLSNFGELNKETVAFQRLTGQTAPLLDTMNMKMATSVQYLQVASSLSETLGMNITAAFSPQNIASAAELMNTMGMTAQAAGQLALVSEINKTSVDGTLDTVVSQVNAYNRTNRTALNHGQIVNDIAKASSETLASFAGQSGELGKAAAVARRLGMELKELERIADSLLDFESSIENELQAQLLTGMDINLNKARELALTNQIGKMGEELFKNTVDVEKFSKMNRIAQEGLAKALGMSRQELAKIALQRSAELGITNQALEAAAGATAEDLKRVEAMQQLTISIQKIGQALAGPVELLSRFLSNTFVLNTILGSIAILYGVKIYHGIKNMLASTIATTVSTKSKVAAETAMVKTTSLVNKNLTVQAGLMSKIANDATRASIASGGITPAFAGATVGRGAGGKFTSMGAGAAGSVGTGAAMAGAKLAGKTALRAIPYIGWALLAYDVIKMLTSSKPKEINDGMINPDGGLMVSGPKGSIQLDPQDSIIAGTNLGGQGQSAQSNRELMSKIEELISAVKQGGDVYLDGDKVGTALTKGTYRNS
jgi:hypothetical protein